MSERRNAENRNREKRSDPQESSDSIKENAMHSRIAVTVLMLLGIVSLTACAQRTQTKPVSQEASVPATKPAEAKAHDFDRWEKEISAYEKADREKMPAKGGVLFIGSSTVRMWKTLDKDFPGYNVINRGFGGSQIVDSTHFAERIIFPYEPKMIFLRAGGNDIHAGKSAKRVFDEYKAFVTKIHGRLPKTQIAYIALCPAPSRWAERDANKALNELVKEFSKNRPYLKYVETYDMSLTADGQAREELFLPDRLHFNAEGYKILADRVRPFMPK